MDNRNNGGGFAPRQMYKGNWSCAGCGVSITELPFEPDGNRPVYCRNCHRSRKPASRF